MTMRTMALGLILLGTACATTASVRRDDPEDPRVTKALAGKVAGEPRSCLSRLEARNSSTYRGTILYRVNRNLTYRNDAGGCPALNDDSFAITRLYGGGQLCSGDIMTFVQRGSGATFGGCALGKFVPYRTAAR